MHACAAMAAANACSGSEADDSGAKWTYEQVTDKLSLYTLVIAAAGELPPGGWGIAAGVPPSPPNCKWDNRRIDTTEGW